MVHAGLSAPFTFAHFDPRRSLRARVGLTFGGIALALAFLLSLVVGSISRQQLEGEIGQSLAELSYQMTDKLDRGMFERYKDIQILAGLDVLRDPDVPTEEKRTLLERLQSTYPNYAWIGFADMGGMVRYSTGALLEGADVSERPWYVGAQEQTFVGDVHEAVLLANLLPNPSSEPLRFVDVATPVYDENGMMLGVLGAHLSWGWATEVRNVVISPLQNARGIEMFVVSGNGNVLLAPSRYAGPPHIEQPSFALATNGEQGFRTENWSENETNTVHLTGYAATQGYNSYPGLGWVVLVRQPAAIAFASAQQLQQTILLLGIVFGVVFALIGWMMAGRIAAPLVAIQRAAERIRQGDDSVQLPQLNGQDEVTVLSESLRSLVATLNRQKLELVRFNYELETRVQERTADLQQRNEDLDAFARTVAHDLKNPLGMVVSYADLILFDDQKNNALDPEVKTFIERILEGGRKMRNITDELLLLAQMKREDIEFSPVDMAAVAEDARQRLAYTIDKAKAEVIMPTSWPTVQSYAPWITEVWANYISNAIKYGGKPARVELGYDTADVSGMVRFWVKDNGPGLTDEQQAKLFTQFTRFHQTRAQGHGLGLSIVRRIVEKLGGEVGVESTMGEGSKFFFTLPTKKRIEIEETDAQALAADKN